MHSKKLRDMRGRLSVPFFALCIISGILFHDFISGCKGEPVSERKGYIPAVAVVAVSFAFLILQQKEKTPAGDIPVFAAMFLYGAAACHISERAAAAPPSYEGNAMISGVVDGIGESEKYIVVETEYNGFGIKLFLKKPFEKKIRHGDSVRAEAFVKSNASYDRDEFPFVGFCRSFSTTGNGNMKLRHVAKNINSSVCERIDKLMARHVRPEKDPQTSASIIKAMITGNTSGISDKTSYYFSMSGIMHLLSLSGLHLAIVYTMLCNMLFFLPKTKRWLNARFCLIIICIWAFTFVTGMNVATVRSAVFVTLRQIANVSFRSLSAGNILGISLIAMTSIEPGIIYDIGFQLSFSAVASILLLHPEIAAIIKSRISVKIMRNICESASISVLCQLTSGSLAMLYFGNFPKYFLIGNLLAVPASTAAIYLGIAMLAAGDNDFAGHVLCNALHYTIMFIYRISEWLS